MREGGRKISHPPNEALDFTLQQEGELALFRRDQLSPFAIDGAVRAERMLLSRPIAAAWMAREEG